VREELKLPKSARGDIKALMSIEERWFRRVTEDFLVMRRMITAYRTMTRTHQQLLNKYKALSEAEKEVLRPVIKSLEVQMEEMARRIAEEAGKRYQAYNRLVDGLGIRGNIKAQEALAELIAYLDPSKGFRKTRNLLGLFKPIRGGRRIYSGHLRRVLQRLTTSTNNISPLQLTARVEKEMLSRVWRIYRQEALGRLAMPAQG
jgi:DNA-binding MurR/RpiR family transcriptional regulator